MGVRGGYRSGTRRPLALPFPAMDGHKESLSPIPQRGGKVSPSRPHRDSHLLMNPRQSRNALPASPRPCIGLVS
ncbi:hypothetical protein DsansV1_C24g0181081 [Dioscorea sansibarensis]